MTPACQRCKGHRVGSCPQVQPEKGSAIVFNDCFDNGAEDGRSLHAGQPPLSPGTVKYAINGWIRSRSVYSRMGGAFGGLFG